ncbi:MAG TPA: CapA family protein [Gemmatimonadaceae bacterium]|nr:CapA family protein [Gemmatimonadaceae bacterium]
MTADSVIVPGPGAARAALTLIAVGDLQLGDSPTTVGYGFHSRYRGTPLDTLLTAVAPALAGGEIVFGNLETTLVSAAAGERRRGTLQLRGEPSYAGDLRRAGFTVVNVANNHAVQHGDATFHATLATVRAAGIACCGVRGVAPWASEPVLLPGAGGPVGLLGYCLRPRQYGHAEPPYAEGTAESIRADVERLRARGAIVVVSLHWGEEFVPQPSASEVALGRSIIDAGAALVLGHHPHVVRPVERYKHGVIAYSLGNFIGDMVWYPPFRRGAILRCSLNDGGVVEATTRTTVLGHDFRPVLADQDAAAPVATAALEGLDVDAYAREISLTMRRQRRASYRAALANLPRTPPAILAQLASDTVHNKVGALAARLRQRLRSGG